MLLLLSLFCAIALSFVCVVRCTYPVSEDASSGLLLFAGNAVGIIVGEQSIPSPLIIPSAWLPLFVIVSFLLFFCSVRSFAVV